VSPDAGERVHLSIGDVLAQLRGEFPDVTISKIRFLESQGLIDPERTPSGYRKFYTDDLDRLRWILIQQREHFLPLRVIKERLERFGRAGAPPESRNGDDGAATAEAPTPPPQLAPAPRTAAARVRRPRPEMPTLPLEEAAGHEADSDIGPIDPGAPASDTALVDRTELLRATGLGERQLDELEEYLLVVPLIGEDGSRAYDDEATAVARVAEAFYRRGVHARHLKMYQHFAEREAALFTQVLLSYVHQRNPSARARLQGELEELAQLGRQLRTTMLRRALRDSLDE
jgi:DNA-binding transcriptional MerR regulator